MYNVVICLRKKNLSNLGIFLRTPFEIPFVPIVYEDDTLLAWYI